MAANSDYAHLAALFTTVDEPSAVRVSVDLLLLGHLPVQGGLWLIPYAGRESAGGIGALIRMHDDTVDLAIVGDTDVDISQCNSLEDAFEILGAEITNWMVQPPSDADSTALLHCDADRITLLSGADQAAVVGAYRLLKGLVVASGDVEPTPAMNLVIVGTEERAAQDAANRIVQTAHHQLGVQLTVSQPLPAMSSSSRVASQGSFQRTSGVVDILTRIRAASQRTSEPQKSQEVEQAIPLTSRPVVEFEEPVVETPPTLIQEKREKQSYASYVDGLIGIKPRCPEHEEVELAIDANGRLHVLADAEDFRDATIVSGWVMRHRELITMACGAIEINITLTPQQHVFTDTALSVADLHGTDLALHLLTEVEVDGRTGWFCTPLN
jgi:hypothetical protein